MPDPLMKCRTQYSANLIMDMANPTLETVNPNSEFE